MVMQFLSCLSKRDVIFFKIQNTLNLKPSLAQIKFMFTLKLPLHFFLCVKYYGFRLLWSRLLSSFHC